mgnify:CR=1 FL=1
MIEPSPSTVLDKVLGNLSGGYEDCTGTTWSLSQKSLLPWREKGLLRQAYTKVVTPLSGNDRSGPIEDHSHLNPLPSKEKGEARAQHPISCSCSDFVLTARVRLASAFRHNEASALLDRGLLAGPVVGGYFFLLFGSHRGRVSNGTRCRRVHGNMDPNFPFRAARLIA